jgi:hypothetical protein
MARLGLPTAPYVCFAVVIMRPASALVANSDGSGDFPASVWR